MKNHIQTGQNIDVPAPSAISSGDGVLIGELFGVASKNAQPNEIVAIATTGVFELPKAVADTLSLGDPVFWDAGNGEATATDTGVKIGVATASAIAPVAVAHVRLNGSL